MQPGSIVKGNLRCTSQQCTKRSSAAACFAEFNQKIADIVLVNSKDESILDKKVRGEELIKKCIEYGEEALIVKASDVLDNYKYYVQLDSEEGINHCVKNVNRIKKFIPDSFQDKIFTELMNFHDKVKN